MATPSGGSAMAATSEMCAAQNQRHQYMLIFGVCMVDIALVSHHQGNKQALWRTSMGLGCLEATPI